MLGLSKISVVISWRSLTDAASFFKNYPFEIIEASFVGKFKIFSDNKVEILIYKFESPESVGRPPLEPSEIVIPLFVTGFHSERDEELEVAWITFNSISPNISPGLQKIKSYPFDSDCFRHCIQTTAAKSKFYHFQRLDFGSTHQEFRFGFFLMDPSGCLVPYLDGERVIQTNPPAGVWCTGVLDERQSTSTAPITFHTWLSVLRYAFASRGQRVFCTSPVLAVHSAMSNSISFYSIRCNGAELPRSPCIEFPSPASTGHTYASRLNFHLFTGFENVKSRSSRVSSQRVVLHLTNLSPVHLPNEMALADYSKMLEAVVRLFTNLDCQVIRGPSPALEIASASRKSSLVQSKQNGRAVVIHNGGYCSKRSVKFHLPKPKVTTPPPFSHPSAVTGFEVPEASMLLEEGVIAASTPAYSPYRYFPSPPLTPLPPPPQLPQCCHPQASRACYHLKSSNNCNSSPAAHEEISRLEALVERLLAAQQPHQIPTTETMEKVTVGTNTSIAQEVCSVAVNTSAVWPTAADIGLVPAPLSASPAPSLPTPRQPVESVGVQCDSIQNCLPQLQGVCPFAGEFNQSLDFLPSPQSPLPQSSESVLSLDAGFSNKPLSPLDPPPHQNSCNENTIVDTGYSRLLAGIQQVLGSAPHIRKTVSVPNELSLLAVDAVAPPPRLSSTSAAPGVEWPSLTDADAEADVARHRRRCEEEVAARLNFSHSLLPLKTDVSSRGGPGKSTPLPGQSEASFSIAHNSFTPTSDLPPPSPSLPPRRYSRHSPKSTDESAILMGLARKYLPPSIIAQLAPPTASTTTISPEVSYCGADFSLATQHYLMEHGLLSARECESTRVPEEGWDWRGRIHCTEVSDIPRLTVMEGSDVVGTRESYLPCSRVFSTVFDEKQEAGEAVENMNLDAPVLDLEHLRALPKLL
ncbi:unnamed protein product [Taenia asiatica]|uniref:Uncharacterized protein n=1 Tax=Taenia asiatica TaxID=60517 RepID=A0A0R3W1G1_TAEAS|nr:unnamed protein product [Taenia asiatica]